MKKKKRNSTVKLRRENSNLQDHRWITVVKKEFLTEFFVCVRKKVGKIEGKL